jgi:excisionase family DNA binding protein
MENRQMGYYSTRQAAERLGCSAKTISRAAKKAGVGIHFIGGRLAALAPADLLALKPHIHETSGNPDWIAAAKPKKTKKLA